jgi:hypothetical protein
MISMGMESSNYLDTTSGYNIIFIILGVPTLAQISLIIAPLEL